MKVKCIAEGRRHAEKYQMVPGDILELEDKIANSFINSGHVEAVEGEAVEEATEEIADLVEEEVEEAKVDPATDETPPEQPPTEGAPDPMKSTEEEK